MELSVLGAAMASCAAIVAGAVNALAGGGTLVTFPTLVGLGVGPLAANVTNTVALCPGYVGGALGQRRDLAGQRRLLWATLPASAMGGAVGAWLLLQTGQRVFVAVVPFLILMACALLAMQESVRRRLALRAGDEGSAREGIWTALLVAVAGLYGGYFGAGLSVIVLAVLGLTGDESLTRLNAAKQLIALVANLAAAVVFALSGRVIWPVAAAMAIGAMMGGYLGGRMAGRVRAPILRWVVVVVGLLVAVGYLAR